MTDSQKWLVFAFISGSAWLVYLLSPVLMPFAFAAMLAYLGDPLTDRLETYQLSRTKAVLVVFFCDDVGFRAGFTIARPSFGVSGRAFCA